MCIFQQHQQQHQHQRQHQQQHQQQNIGNAHKALCRPGLLDVFAGLDKTLEKIQKSLDDYLELKRQQFPRFYFLSNDNLLDILGLAKDPQNVQVHDKAKT